MKRLGNRYAVQGDERVVGMLRRAFGEENVKLQQIRLEKDRESVLKYQDKIVDQFARMEVMT